MITIKNEGFSSSFPSWLVKALERGEYYRKSGSDRNRKANIAWDTAEYIPAKLPTSARAREYKDPNRLQVFLLDDGTSRTSNQVYIPELGIIPSVWNNRTRNYVNANRLNFNDLANMTVEYGYIDKSKDNTLDKRRDRANAKKGSIEREPNMGQKWSDYSQKWLTSRGYDKSGYPLNPDKYINMLAKMDVNDTEKASKRVEMYYNQIEDVRNKIIKELSKSSKDLANSKGKGSFSSNRMEDLSNAIGYLSRAMYDYKNLLKSIEDLNKNKGKSGSEKEENAYKSWVSLDLKRNGEEIKEYLKKAKELLD